ncbi:MAG: acyl carrier protein [Betaproteobacteria bacterium]|nr:acyl carrier protein [Betaproteobacteria bacterium]MDE2211974.1 acyl carrier protein [Betaproteobacteria bacterium]MDE2354052.1 acyl carrier protein [Betaproteobacteria bacterium]MDE2624549.1 acyl carrier protein [Betaproteobacteria bacterium]
MRTDPLYAQVIAVLQAIAPEVEAEDLVPGEPLRRQVDLDSMDWLNFLIGLHRAFQVDIPESDYARLVTLDDVADYLQKKTGSGTTRSG